MTRPRSYCGCISGLPREAQLAYADGAWIAERVGQMPDRSSEAPLEQRLALGDLAPGRRCMALCQDRVGESVRANRYFRLTREHLNLVPTEAEIHDEPACVHAGLRGEVRGHRPQPLLRPSAKVSIDSLEGSLFLDRRAVRQIQHPAVAGEHHTVEPSDRLLQFQPPQAATTIDEVCRDEQCPRCTVPPQNWPSVLEVVAITVVEGQSRKSPSARTRAQPVGDRIEWDNVKPLASQFGQDEV